MNASCLAICKEDSGVPAVRSTRGNSLLLRIASGDEEAVAELFDRYGRLVWSIATRLTRNRADAEDAVQEIMVSVWRSAARYDPAIASEATFICIIARRRSIDLARGARRESEAIRARAREQGEQARSSLVHEQAESSTNWLGSMLAMLTPKQAHYVRLAFGRGLANRAIALETGWKPAAVERYGRSGLCRLRQLAQRSLV